MLFFIFLLAIPLFASPLHPTGSASVLFFVTNDCPVANSYAPEIQRICRDYAAKGVSCSLVYSDLSLDEAAIQKHHAEYGYPDSIPAVRDAGHKLASATGATITPEAVIVGKAGKVLYRGRIDNFYAGLGKPRRQVTEHDLRDALDEVLAGRGVAHPNTQAVGCYIPR